MKHRVIQKYIFKIHTDRLKAAKWNLELSLSDARANGDVISIGDSQMLRWIDELNGIENVDEQVKAIRREIRSITNADTTVLNRHRIKKLYEQIDAISFKQDYMHLVVDSITDFRRACKGFSINGVKYTRLLGTSGGVKCNTIVFVSERVAPELRKRIDNGRNVEVPLVPAKLEAYKALTCSSSTPVSMPKGILVVPDCVTHFKEDVLYLTDENDGEPELRLWKDFDVSLTESDGYGLMLPSLAERWSEEMKLGYTASAVNTRCSWEKGCVFAFDFQEFADNVAGTRMVKDAWGNDVNIGNVELILTTSMLKLWSCYDSIEHYLKCCEDNHYSFAIAKAAPEQLEDVRATNYQYLQSYYLTDEQIDELIGPTIDGIREVVAGDYRKAILYMAGTNLTEDDLIRQSPWTRAMMVEPQMYNDPFIRHRIKRSLHKRIEDARIGVIDVHANYSILCGDPYALCQSIFGLEVTGLLKADEIYNRYWLDSGASEVAVFRSPMSCHNSILRRKIARGEAVEHWYQYIRTCTLFNAWSTGTDALNGADKDGDIVFLTDNKVLVENIRPTLTLMCAQKSAQKKIVTEADLIQSNIDGFGNDVGKVTNYITSMYDVQAQFEPGSIEYETLAYRIQAGQQAQQNSIDKTKGIVCKPMPAYWYEPRALKRPESGSEEDIKLYELNKRVIADRKPYFMRYIYPALMKDYKKYDKTTNAKSLIEFGIPVSQLEKIPESERTERQNEFMTYYKKMMPVGSNDSTMNRICRRVEELTEGIKFNEESDGFDYTIMKSGAKYTETQCGYILKLFNEHKNKLQNIVKRHMARVKSKEDFADYRETMIRHFIISAYQLCSNRMQLLDIILDICYKREGTKQFAWDVVGDDILESLLDSSGNKMYYPVLDPDGDIEYRGDTYSMMRVEVSRLGDCPE